MPDYHQRLGSLKEKVEHFLPEDVEAGVWVYRAVAKALMVGENLELASQGMYMSEANEPSQ